MPIWYPQMLTVKASCAIMVTKCPKVMSLQCGEPRETLMGQDPPNQPILAEFLLMAAGNLWVPRTCTPSSTV